ncbi:MAG: JAB domain-containing protein [Lachnospiraceae bacterium]|nr:JAB domain-containing protein [Lachnospiraceae bacterium]
MRKNLTMKQLPPSERPYEKCETTGAESLSDKELLSVIIRTGTKTERADEVALRLLEYCGNDGLQSLWNMKSEDLKDIPGIGRVKSIQILCICELAKRLARGKRLVGRKVSSPEDIIAYYNIHLKYQEKESLILLILDSKNRILSEEMLSIGTINTSIADPREIFYTALKKNAVSILLLHNHPSGDPTPSTEDILVTKRIKDAGALLGIPLYDHIIIGQNSYVSLRGEKYLEF